MKIKSKIWLEKDGNLILGTGKARILRAVCDCGSINKAAKKLNMSYRRAWSNLKAIEERLEQPLLIKEKGGKEGGGAVLTVYAKELLQRFELMDSLIRNF